MIINLVCKFAFTEVEGDILGFPDFILSENFCAVLECPPS